MRPRVGPAQIPQDAWVLELDDIEGNQSTLLERVRFAERRSKSTKYFFRRGDVLYGKLRPYLNKVIVADEEGFCSTEIVPITTSTAINARYLMYWLRHRHFSGYAEAASHGLSMPRLGRKAALDAPVLVAPAREQESIVAALDQAYEQLRNVREGLDEANRQVALFRQAVVDAAVAGHLTRQWRSANHDAQSWSDKLADEGAELPPNYQRLQKRLHHTAELAAAPMELPSGWAARTVSELYASNVLIDFADGNHGSLYPRKADFSSEADGPLFLTASQIDDDGHIDLSSCPRLSGRRAAMLKKGWVQRGDVLLTHNATVGRVGIVDTDDEILLGTSVTFYRFNDDHLLPQFASILFNSFFVQDQLMSVMRQATRNQVPISRQNAITLLCPPLEEQQLICNIVTRAIQRIATAHRALDRAQSIAERVSDDLLARAFDGDLVPPLEEDTYASQLLENSTFSEALKAAKQTPTLPSVQRATEDLAEVPSTHDASSRWHSTSDKPAELVLATMLRESGALAPDELWRRSGLDINVFYETLRDEVRLGFVRERHIAGASDARVLEAPG